MTRYRDYHREDLPSPTTVKMKTTALAVALAASAAYAAPMAKRAVSDTYVTPALEQPAAALTPQ